MALNHSHNTEILLDKELVDAADLQGWNLYIDVGIGCVSHAHLE